MLSRARSLIPAPLMRAYHLLLATTGALRFGNPSKRMIVIGVTGTSGKSTTVFLLGHILSLAGHKVGSSSTIEFRVGDVHELNKTKMTQLGRWGTERLLARMAAAGCDVAVVETTSQGIEQFRHRGVYYDVCVLTNLYPEHIEAHGGFENYKNAKKKLFSYLATLPPKPRFNIPKTIIVNGEVAEAAEFCAPAVARHWSFKKKIASCERALLADAIELGADHVSFTVDLEPFFIPLKGAHIVDDALAAIAAAEAIGVGLAQSASALRTIAAVPGRAEFILCGQPFTIVVDFAFEPVAMQKLYAIVAATPHAHVLHVLGGTGGGRDRARRAILGNIAGEHADLVYVTNEDPYDEDPRAIMEMVADGARGVGKIDDQNLFVIEDRRAAIATALRAAREGDMILITGKGSEQAIVGAHRTATPWDDRAVVREELARINPQWQSTHISS